MAAAMTITLVTGPAVHAADGHTIDYIVVSPAGNTDFISTADLTTITSTASNTWNRMSRGKVTGFQMGDVATIPDYPLDQFCRHTVDSARVTAALGRPADTYDGRPNGRALVIIGNAYEMTSGNCNTWGGWTVTKGNGFATGGTIFVRYYNLTTGAQITAHELGHTFGLGHAGVVPTTCTTDYRDGPFTDPSDPSGCGMDTAASYGDTANVMGTGYADGLDINGYQKYQLGLIQPGAGLVRATPATTDKETITIRDTRTTSLTAKQAIQFSDDDPDGAGPCAAPLYDIDYDPGFGGVRIYHVATPGDCGMAMTGVNQPKTIAWMVPTGSSSRTYFLPGESQLTASGNIRVKVASADPAAGTATVSIRRTEPEPTLQVSSQDLSASTTVAAAGGTLTGTVTTNQASWSATSDQPWVTVTASGTTGQRIVVSVEANKTTTKRTAQVTVSAKTAVSTFVLTQSPRAVAPLSVAPTTLNAKSGADSQSVKVTTTEAWSVTGPDWVSTTTPSGRGNATVNLTIAANTTGKQRSGTVTFTANGQTAKVTINQPAAPVTLSVNPVQLSPVAAGETQVVRITASGDWTVKVPDWVRVSPSSGKGNSSITVTSTANATGQARTGRLTITSGSKLASVTVAQPAMPQAVTLSLSTTSITSASWGTQQWVKVTSNGHWTVTAPNWMYVNPSSGDGEGWVSVSVYANDTGSNRLGQVVFKAGSQIATTWVSQSAQHAATYLETPISYMNAPVSGATVRIWFYTDGPWRITGPSWLHVSNASGTGSAAVDVHVDPAGPGVNRAAWLNITAGTKTAWILVVQS